MRHAVIGAGNLGLDIAYALAGAGHEIDVYSKSFGQNVLDTDYLIDDMNRQKYSAIWYTVGFGSVNEAINSYKTAADIHVNVPVALARGLHKGAKLVVFSSDYVADENHPDNPNRFAVNPRSLYANLKKRSETELITRNHLNRSVAVIRVGSLYGVHKPEATFPGRLLINFAKTTAKIRLPQNMVTPTPTAWLGQMMAANMEYLFSFAGTKMHHCAPAGNVSVRDWAMFVLAGVRDKRDFNPDSDMFYDHARPYFSALGCSLPLDFVPHWYTMWRQLFNRDVYTARIDVYRTDTEA